MDYHVIMIEYGRPTHHWFFTEVDDAIIQLERLNHAFEECDEVYATLVKSRPSDRYLTPDQLLQLMIVPPRTV